MLIFNMSNPNSSSLNEKIDIKFQAQRKNILELENELDYCKEELIDCKKKNAILNQNIDLLRQEMEELEAELRNYKKLNQMGDIEGV